MTKHTDGPWTLGHKTASYECMLPKNATLDDRVRLERLQALGLSQMECASVGTPNSQVAIIPLDESSYANAHLIAAAPDLLEACMKLIESSKFMREEYSDMDDDVVLARAAIAKATVSE